MNKKKFEAKRAELHSLTRKEQTKRRRKREELYTLAIKELVEIRMRRRLRFTKKKIVKQIMLQDVSQNEKDVIRLTNALGVNCINTKLMRSGGYTIFSEWKKKDNYLFNISHKKRTYQSIYGR